MTIIMWQYADSCSYICDCLWCLRRMIKSQHSCISPVLRPFHWFSMSDFWFEWFRVNIQYISDVMLCDEPCKPLKSFWTGQLPPESELIREKQYSFFMHFLLCLKQTPGLWSAQSSAEASFFLCYCAIESYIFYEFNHWSLAFYSSNKSDLYWFNFCYPLFHFVIFKFSWCGSFCIPLCLVYVLA